MPFWQGEGMKQSVALFIGGLLLVTGCAPSTRNVILTTPAPSATSKPTQTQMPSRTPTISLSVTPILVPTMTNVPTATLASYKWKPAPILITYDSDWDGFCSTVCPPDPAPFILYGDGNFFLYTSVDINGNTQFRYLHKKLDRSAICRLLNTIGQTGFLDFDPATYSIPRIYDAANWRIEIYAWKNKDVKLYGLGEIANDLNSDLSLIPSNLIKPASVRDTFALLYNYPVDELDVYIPPRLGIWLWKSSFDFSSTEAWTLDDISLARLYKKAGSAVDTMPRPIYFDGEDAKNVYAMFDNFTYYGEVTQNGERYGIYVRPVLPFEKISGGTSVIAPQANQLKLAPSLYCSPIDGTMPIPHFDHR